MSKHSPQRPSKVSASSSRSEASPPTPVIAIKSSHPHELECLIQRGLQSRPGLKFSRLTVHKYGDCVCLEGMLEENEDGLDLCDLVKEIAGVKAINRVVMRPTSPK